MSSSPKGNKKCSKKGSAALSMATPSTDQSFAAAIMAYRSLGNRKRTISVGGISPLARLSNRHMQTSSTGANLSYSSLDDRRLYHGGGGSHQGARHSHLPSDERLKAKGNIFIHRNEYSKLIEQIPLIKRSMVHTKFEDDGPFGNDESRIGLLSQLSELGKTELLCAICHKTLIVYDRYPLIDGTIFLSPISRQNAQFEKGLC